MRASAQSFVEYECNAVRAETPLAGSVLPVRWSVMIRHRGIPPPRLTPGLRQRREAAQIGCVGSSRGPRYHRCGDGREPRWLSRVAERFGIACALSARRWR